MMVRGWLSSCALPKPISLSLGVEPPDWLPPCTLAFAVSMVEAENDDLTAQSNAIVRDRVGMTIGISQLEKG